MNSKLATLALLVTVVFSCKKDADNNSNTYIVSAPKMIAIANNDWPASEPQLKNKTGYKYTKSAENISNFIKAEVALPAIDDSNRLVKGSILLNVAPDDKIFHASFTTGPLSKAIAFGMFLNYNNQTLQNVSGISYSMGGYVENGNGGNTTAAAILSKIASGQDAKQLDVTYGSGPHRYTMIVSSETNGQYVFTYRAN